MQERYGRKGIDSKIPRLLRPPSPGSVPKRTGLSAPPRAGAASRERYVKRGRQLRQPYSSISRSFCSNSAIFSFARVWNCSSRILVINSWYLNICISSSTRSFLCGIRAPDHSVKAAKTHAPIKAAKAKAIRAKRSLAINANAGAGVSLRPLLSFVQFAVQPALGAHGF
jgi:hypothetical protein